MTTMQPAPPVPAAADAASADAALTGGRKYPRGPRKDRVVLRLTDEEWERVRARIAQTGRTNGRYLRELVLGAVPKARPTLANAAAVRELARVGNNLNQLAREANAAGDFPAEGRIQTVLDEVLATIRRLG